MHVEAELGDEQLGRVAAAAADLVQTVEEREGDAGRLVACAAGTAVVVACAAATAVVGDEGRLGGGDLASSWSTRPVSASMFALRAWSWSSSRRASSGLLRGCGSAKAHSRRRDPDGASP
jgi:hypothetical protein